MNKNWILASQSPRRRELLSLICSNFKVIPSLKEEVIQQGLLPYQAVIHLAKQKAEDVFKSNPECLVIGADTVVAIDNCILGKPKDNSDCQRMLRMLSGKVHQVYTGVALVTEDKCNTFYATTDVEFLPLSKDDILWYSSTTEPYDKAGAYGIQGQGSLLIKGICGDHYNVMGLPVSALYQELKVFCGSGFQPIIVK